MKKFGLMLGASAVALMASLPANALLGYNVKEARDLQVDGHTFGHELAREYKSFARYEADRMVDWIDADYFAGKALAAARGETPMPEKTEDWSLGRDEAAELADARQKLIAALDSGGRMTHPDTAARAQANFDCWMEQQEEGWQTLHIAACKDTFYAALAAMQVKPEPPTPPAQYLPIEEGAVVYFDHDSDALRADSQRTLETLATRLTDDRDIVVKVTGHADRSGSAEYNQALSERRAAAVIAGLRALGVTTMDEVEAVEMEARGELAPAVETADGVREPANRRVVVEAFARERVPAVGKRTAALN